jgi:hypothetical protein
MTENLSETTVVSELSDDVAVVVSAIEEALLPFGETISPYHLAGVASVFCEKYVREQMLYSYVKKGLIPSAKQDGKIRISSKDATQWLFKYVLKHSS